MKIEIIDINKLNSPEWNPRFINDEDFEKLKNSLEEFGYVDPIIVNKHNMNIVGGNQRYLALKDLGYDEIEVIFINEPDLNKEKALNIALNKISGDWDTAKLESILDEISLSDFDVELTGFDETELKDFDINISSYDKEEKEDIIDEIEEDDFDYEEEMEVNVKYGDMFKLGNHILLCGDSTNKDDINKLIDGNKINMVYTDPPYGMHLDTDWSNAKSNLKFYQEKGCNGSGNKYNKVIGDNDDFTPKLILTVFDNFKDTKEIFLWGADYYAEIIPNKNDGSWFVWDKRSNDDTKLEYVQQSDKMFGSTFELCWSKTRHKREIARVKWAGIFGTEKEFDRKRHHPTQKPMKLSGWFINKFSNENDNIVDLFGGSGSTLLACEELNRNCFMMELDPYYCQVIINRWENYTSQKAEKIGDEN